jgi:threonine dehydrogenase-like Zn-dependent dehydrogenase
MGARLLTRMPCQGSLLANPSLTECKGRAVKVGSKVKDIKVGDRVGVGAQVGADLNCDNCKADQENYCPNQ